MRGFTNVSLRAAQSWEQQRSAGSWEQQMSADGKAKQVPIELEDVEVLRRELPELRMQCELLAKTLRRTRRELAMVKSQHKEVTQQTEECEAEIIDVSRRLGCPEEGLRELGDWRQLAKEELLKGKKLQEELEAKKLQHESHMAQLKRAIERQGRPETPKALEADENKRKRRAADDRCARLQLVRDYITGALPEMTDEQLKEILQPGPCEPPPAEVQREEGWMEDAQEALEEVVEELSARGKADMSELAKLSNAVMKQKDRTWQCLQRGALYSGMDNPRRCHKQEHSTIKDVLDDAEVICRMRQAEGDMLELPSNPKKTPAARAFLDPRGDTEDARASSPSGSSEGSQQGRWQDWRGW